VELDPENSSSPREVTADYLLSASDRLDLLVKREAVVTATAPIAQSDFQSNFNVIRPLDRPVASPPHLGRWYHNRELGAGSGKVRRL
jgi:hypothetical protein